ncbi:MAG: aldehyde dehydrogenase [Bacteroidales bacterium]|jgi:aldehyde dehydrogenase (NAD+)|nr:aldehyde dehydrogenase [Bacteroidales bacterium]
MENLLLTEIENTVKNQRAFFAANETKAISFRIEQLKKLKSAVLKHEQQIAIALGKDLHKSYEEAYLTEIGIILSEINNHIKHLKRWSKPKRISTPLFLQPSRSKVIYEPLGVSLIISPWNYPFQLLINPLIGAISAGCCSVLKPSAHAPAVANAINNLITETFDKKYIATIQGDIEANTLLLQQRFDIIFFTGSPTLGKIVMQAAAQYLTPLVLELGGKSPCIVDMDANLDVAAKRIIWGKTINAGQTCVAPDYLFVHKEVKEELIRKIIKTIKDMFGENCRESKYYPRIVNAASVKRLQRLMQNGDIVYGGDVDEEDRYISPTIIDNVKPDSPLMQEEIFGPLLPLMTFEDINEVIHYVNANEKPLALYYFGSSKKANNIFSATSSGGGCINDTIMHIANHHLPFGGVGNSGMGRYHGYDSFLTFSNPRAIVSSPVWIDVPVKYVPFKYFNKVKKILRW